MTEKRPLRPLAALTPPVKRPDQSKQLTSEHISAHLAAFEASGGTVEVLGTTRVLKRVDDVAVPHSTIVKPA